MGKRRKQTSTQPNIFRDCLHIRINTNYNLPYFSIWKIYGNPSKMKVISHNSARSLSFSLYLYLLHFIFSSFHKHWVFQCLFPQAQVSAFNSIRVGYLDKCTFDNYRIYGENDPNQIGFKGWQFILKYKRNINIYMYVYFLIVFGSVAILNVFFLVAMAFSLFAIS